MIVIVVDPKLVSSWLVPVLRGIQRALQAAATALKHLAD